VPRGVSTAHTRPQLSAPRASGYSRRMGSRLVALAAGLSLSSAAALAAAPLGPGDPAPLFTATTHTGERFDLASRTGHWTVLFFFPKAGTSGCTAQANAFSDRVDAIRVEGAEVYGISADSVEAQAEFRRDEQLDFTLLADPDGTVIEQYGAKMPLLTMSKRWTFIIDPELTIRHVDRDVDPALDAQHVSAELARLTAASAPAAPTPPAPR